MKTIEYKYDCPEFLCYALEYGEIMDDFTEEDCNIYSYATKVLETTKKDLEATHYTLQFGEETYFKHTSDFTNLGCTCVELTVTFFIKE